MDPLLQGSVSIADTVESTMIASIEKSTSPALRWRGAHELYPFVYWLL